MYRFIVISLFLFLASFSNAKSLDSFISDSSPIQEFAFWASSQSGVNIVLSQDLDGVITAHVNELDSEDIIPFFVSTVEANGYSVKYLDKTIFVSKGVVSSVRPITKVYHLMNIRASKLISSVKTILNDEGDAKVNLLNSSNAIAVSASQESIELLGEIFLTLDKKQKQILIEAVIIESDLGDSEELGVNIASALNDNGFSYSSSTTESSISNSLGALAIYSKGGDIRGLISAISRSEKSKLLSTPSLLVLNTERGHISVGQNVPFIASNETTDGGKTIQTIKRKDVGVSLSVTPTILNSGRIILDILQESSSVTNSNLASDIITNTRSIDTTVALESDETVSLGGLISDEKTYSRIGVPGLKSIPFIGRLFSSKKVNIKQKEMTVILKAIVL